MPSFEYQGLSASGQTITGRIDAPDKSAAVQTLLGRGEVATVIRPLGGKNKAKSNGAATATAAPAFEPSRASAGGLGGVFGGRAARPTMGRAEIASLVRELATAIEAGLPIMQALRTVRRQANTKAMESILDHLIERVEAGAPLYKAAREYGPPFDDMIVGMLRAADASGRMAEVMLQLADLLDRSVELRREVIGATVYPFILLLLMIASVVIIVTVVVPNLLKPLAGEGLALPWPTQVLMGLATFFQSNWIYLTGGLILALVFWRAWSSVPSNRLKIDHALLKAPVLGPLLRDVAVARFTRTLGTLASAGIPLLEALRITRDTLGNRALMAAIDSVQDKVTAGKALADPLERTGLFPALLIQIVNLGERSGRLESMLVHAAGAFDRKVNQSLKIFSKALPQVLTIIMAVLAAFILTAILLPLVDLPSLMK